MSRLVKLSLIPLLLLSFKNPKPYYKLDGFSYIPAGMVYINANISNTSIVDKIYKGIPDSLGAFLISDHEISNGEYAQFLSDIKLSDPDKYLQCLPDTTVWMNKPLVHGDPLRDNYFQHPAYKDYPLVGVSLEQANSYCDWLTIKLNTAHPQIHIRARLPSRTEWIRAARGDKNWKYPLGNYLVNHKGEILYNYQPLGDEYITADPETKHLQLIDSLNEHYLIPMSELKFGPFITTTVRSYYKNEFGLYNCSGNVAELVSDGLALGGSYFSPGFDVRVESQREAEVCYDIGFRVLLEIVE